MQNGKFNRLSAIGNGNGCFGYAFKNKFDCRMKENAGEAGIIASNIKLDAGEQAANVLGLEMPVLRSPRATGVNPQ